MEWGLNCIAKKICFYISDHGYGHATRDIAIIRHLRSTTDIDITVKTNRPYNLVRDSLPNVKLIDCINDKGVVLENLKPKVDRNKTLALFEMWCENWESYTKKETIFCKENNIDLIISDIAPQPFLVANELGIPSIAISNFTWHSVFSYIYGNNTITKRLEDAYKCATLACVLPFSEPMKVFNKRVPVSLVSRNIDVPRYELRKSLGIGNNEKLIYAGLGKSMDESILSNLFGIEEKNIKLLLPSGVKINSERNIGIPLDYTETQNYLGACDLIVSKAGYSTVSEAVKAKVPIFIFQRKDFYEDIFLAKEIKKLKIGEIISFEEFVSSDWINKIDKLTEYGDNYAHLGKRYTEDGCTDIKNIVKGLID
ncbi:MAG: hypothetical protein APG12_01170 [Candidatus Methanofastidiosum methylothiophilum]|uniref:Undecaprenyldiphospho-muramoylpentapeptide beta-N-acetylglucosaminyltransferase n=1 Tax=Candidatus Methanofastidiosum methylothiophilum TaxID=1705564 RepID=A0A150IY53_9EURY|nr:MAG: hypothetical protein APG12_01170 [Candidatus Methanofastidiosum methylthiophilus]